MDLYLPPKSFESGPRQAVVFCYGGAWSSGSRGYYGYVEWLAALSAHPQSGLVGKVLSDKGYVVAVPGDRRFAATCYLTACSDYTLYPSGVVDDMVIDVADALLHVIDSSKTLDIDTVRQPAYTVHNCIGQRTVTLVGHSAGAHLWALLLCRCMSGSMDRSQDILKSVR